MRILKARCVFLTIVLQLLLFPIAAQFASAEDIGEIAKRVPATISQVITGGFWKDDSKSGIFRTIVINHEASEKNKVQVYIQWIATGADNKNLKIVKSVPIKEVSEQKLANAFVYIEGDQEGEITVVITSYDPTKDKDSQIWLTASDPGNYKLIPPEKEETSGVPNSAVNP